MTNQIRLNHFIARAGVASRRRADDLIAHGKVKVNGQIINELGTKINPDTDKVEIDGEVLAKSQTLVYYALNKPRGVISTAADDKGRQTVLDLVPEYPRVFPVGRLDADSEGLILLTNDGEMANRLSHPRYEHEKEYEVLAKVRKQDTRPLFSKIKSDLESGMIIDGVLMKADRVCDFKYDSEHSSVSFKLILHQGYNRQIRRMCDKIDLRITRLTRIRIGKLKLTNLHISPGNYRQISKSHIL